jgi:CBS-domain-containing membrane protein
MEIGKRVEDIMVSIFDYPHIPYWFSFNQAIRIAKASFRNDSRKSLDPMAMLVFDEKYNLLGTLSVQDIIKGLEPKFSGPGPDTHSKGEDISGWDSVLAASLKEFSVRQVSEIMAPAEYFCEPEDQLSKAAYLMAGNNLFLLPVLEKKRKLVGLVRMLDIFDAISDEVLKK